MSTEDPHATTEPSTKTTAGPGTTSIVNTITSGIIHGSRIDALRIVAGSTFPVEDDRYVRFTPGDEPDETRFHVAIDPDSINVHSYTGHDCVIGGSYEEFYTPNDNHTEIRTRVEFQPPYDASQPFKDVNDRTDGSLQAEYRNNCLPRWNVTDQYVDCVVTDVLDLGTNIVVQLSTLRDLYTPHPEHTVEDDGKHVITDDALVDPDYYETEEPRPDAGHGKGGNPHTVEYHLKRGECPAPGCDATFDLFRELKGHVGGCVSGEDDDGPHVDLNLRRNDVTVFNTIDTTTDGGQ